MGKKNKNQQTELNDLRDRPGREELTSLEKANEKLKIERDRLQREKDALQTTNTDLDKKIKDRSRTTTNIDKTTIIDKDKPDKQVIDKSSVQKDRSRTTTN